VNFPFRKQLCVQLVYSPNTEVWPRTRVFARASLGGSLSSGQTIKIPHKSPSVVLIFPTLQFSENIPIHSPTLYAIICWIMIVDVDWRGFGGRDLIPTHRTFSEGARQPRLIVLATGRKQSTPTINMRTVCVR
jgi:hypothetical protein